MLFNSLEFVIFFPIVVMGFFLMPHRFRWVFLLAASYYFYMCWKPEYLVLIIISTMIDYFAGIQMGKVPDIARRRKYLMLSLSGNLGILFFFKYANFFSESIRYSLNQFNIFYDMPLFEVLLPVGISFYTFQSLSYSIDVYRGKRAPERHAGIFALYVAFFPQLVAGPIERSTRLLPQFHQEKQFSSERLASGLRLMLWGFFKKLVIADRLAIFVDEVYNTPGEFHGLSLLLATYFFAFQIYCDFSGYSDIAIGSARILGYDLMKNFRQPYFAKSISEFWKRWHISLSTWFRDYLYIPLGGNRVARLHWYANLMIVFVVSGLWHGANWTFVLWGFLHGSFLVVAILTSSLRTRITSLLKIDRFPALRGWLQIAVTFHLVLFAWIFFRANTIQEASFIIRHMMVLDFSPDALEQMFDILGPADLAIAILSILFLEAIHYLEYTNRLSPMFYSKPLAVRWAGYYLLLLGIIFFGVFGHTEFIYFQF